MGKELELTRRQVVCAMAATTAYSVGCTPTKAVESKGASKPVQKLTDINPILETKPLPNRGPLPTSDPFLFCVHHNDRYPRGNEKLGPLSSLDGRNMGQDFADKDGWNMYHGTKVPGFPRHPHRGFETVTAVKTGIIDHADSLGAAARYGDGDVQWLTAGDGINHAEMFPLLEQDRGNPLDFFQIWLNLPRARKRAAPYFEMFWSKSVPEKAFRDTEGRLTVATLVAGRYFGAVAPKPPPASWASDPANHVAIMRIEIAANGHWTLPKAPLGVERNLYIIRGAVRLGTTPNLKRVRVSLKADLPCEITAVQGPATLLLLEGKPIGEPIVQHGPFVMNTREEIVQAFADYRATQFGGWPWSSNEPIHGSKRARFAVDVDGRRSEPS